MATTESYAGCEQEGDINLFTMNNTAPIQWGTLNLFQISPVQTGEAQCLPSRPWSGIGFAREGFCRFHPIIDLSFPPSPPQKHLPFPPTTLPMHLHHLVLMCAPSAIGGFLVTTGQYRPPRQCRLLLGCAKVPSGTFMRDTSSAEAACYFIIIHSAIMP